MHISTALKLHLYKKGSNLRCCQTSNDHIEPSNILIINAVRRFMLLIIIIKNPFN